MRKYKEGDIVLIPAKIEQIETYEGEATFFLSSDIWDGYGEIEEKDLEAYEKPKKAEKKEEKRQKEGRKASTGQQEKVTHRQQGEKVIALPAYGKELAKELARTAK